MASYPHVFEYPYSVVDEVPFDMKGRWHEDFFRNDHPIVLELGCGRGEYTVGLARLYPDKNFIGVDIKGARMWTGATEALREGLSNVAFLRTNIEIIDRFFAEGEVAEIWLTFSDPQMKKVTKRLTSTFFMTRYRRFLQDRGRIHLKTDSNFLFTYTEYMVERDVYKRQVNAVAVTVGQAVKKGQTVVVLEAMKMENNINAECDGTVTAVHVNKGDSVREGAMLVTIG